MTPRSMPPGFGSVCRDRLRAERDGYRATQKPAEPALLGEGLHHADHGQFEFHDNGAGKQLRVHWLR